MCSFHRPFASSCTGNADGPGFTRHLQRGAPAGPSPAPGQPERYDYEYRRHGTANLFVVLDAQRPWRAVKVTDRRTGRDFAVCMRDLVDVHYPEAEQVRVVVDNLSTHSAGALYEAFPACEARRVLRRLEFHFVPKHASWLNMVEIEIGVPLSVIESHDKSMRALG
jgi:hypothetical protein